MPIYDKDGWLIPLATHFGLPNAKKRSRVDLYKFLLEKKGDKDLYVFYDELLAIMEAEKFKAKSKVWLFAPGENACMWDECKESQTMRLGWDLIGDLSEFENREEQTKALQVAYGKEDASFKNDSLALWQFAHEVREGDIIYVKKGINKIIGRGVVEGDYRYDETLSTYRHIRKVKWTHDGDWNYSIHKLVQKTLTDISKYPEFVKAMEERHIKYNETLEYIAAEEQKGNVLVIRPDEALPVGRIERNRDNLKAAYEIGRNTAIRKLDKVKKFLK